MSYFKHSLADVQTVNIGSDTKIWQFVVILPNATIGANCNICSHCFIENKVLIGNNVTIKSGVQLWDGVSVEDDVFIGPNVTFTNDLVPRSKVYPGIFKETKISKGASIGANTTLVAGITVGEYAFIGAGSVVTKNVAPYTVWYGNPAKHKGYITKNGVLLDLDLQDKTSGKTYQLKDGRPLAQ